MLFHVMWEFVDTSRGGPEALALGLLAVATAGRRRFGGGFYGFSDGTGGVALVEVGQCRDTGADDRIPGPRGCASTVTPIVPNRGVDAHRERGGRLPRLGALAGRGPTAEVRLAQALVLEQVGRLALEHEPPGREHVAAVSDRERDVRVLLDDEDRDPAPRAPA